MRRAKVRDYWNRLDRGAIPVKIASIAYDSVPGIGTGTIDFGSQLSLLCGPNGVGKTTLLRTLWTLLAPQEAARSSSTIARLTSGRAATVVAVGQQLVDISKDLGELLETQSPNLNFEVSHVDTSSLISAIQDHFCHFPNISDALNGVPVLECSEDQLNDLAYLTQVSYGSARVYSVEEEDRTRPFFEVEVNGVEYDSRTMGLGELAAFYLWWALENLAEGSVLLLEEPESFLSPICQSAFAGILAMYTVRKKAWVVATTHSSALIREAGTKHLSFLYKDGVNSRRSAKPIESLLSGVGIETSADTIMLVEDRASAIFGRLWIAHFDPMSASRVEMVQMGGHGNISKALEAFGGRNTGKTKIIGLYDADQKGQVSGELEAVTAFLPGRSPIEVEYRTMTTDDIERILPMLEIADLKQILFGIRRADAHDWFSGFCRGAKLSEEQLHLMLFKAWIAHAPNGEEARRAFDALAGRAGWK